MATQDEYYQPLKIGILLDRKVDPFGPSSLAVAHSIAWGLNMEFEMVKNIGDLSLLPPAVRLRYQDWEEFVEDELSIVAEGPVMDLAVYYAHNAWDMLAPMRGADSWEDTLAQAQARETWSNIAGGAMTALNFYGQVQDIRWKANLANHHKQEAKWLKHKRGGWF